VVVLLQALTPEVLRLGEQNPFAAVEAAIGIDDVDNRPQCLFLQFG